MSIVLQTDRLVLRQFERGDAPFIVDLVNTPGWIEFIGVRNIKTEEAAALYLQNGPMKSYAEHGFGLWMAETKYGSPIGMCGLLKRDMLDHPDIGFALLPAFTGAGYAHEMAAATLRYANEVLHLKTVFAIVIPSNKRSIALLEKIGLSHARTFLSPDRETLMLFTTESAGPGTQDQN